MTSLLNGEWRLNLIWLQVKGTTNTKTLDMRNIFVLTFSLICLQTLGQEANSSEEWYHDFIENYQLDDMEFKSEFNQYDFSGLFLKTSSYNIFGVIGENMQRIQLKWISVSKDPNNPEDYHVYGKTKVKSNVCSFTGILKIRTIRLYLSGVYDMPYRSAINPKVIGILFCDYVLTEISNEKHTGVFQGISATEFYVNNDTLFYNNLRHSADDMTNNQFVGTWTSHSTEESKICNWGDYRVPNVLNFDCGASEFSPCEDFLQYGWDDFKLASTYGQESEDIKKAREIEEDEWWK
jgi:hypothetical protein